jgi:hypothetical protein
VSCPVYIAVPLIIIRGTAIYTGQDTQTFKLSYRKADRVSSARFRTNEALCELSYGAPYIGPEGGRLGRPIQAVYLLSFDIYNVTGL